MDSEWVGDAMKVGGLAIPMSLKLVSSETRHCYRGNRGPWRVSKSRNALAIFSILVPEVAKVLFSYSFAIADSRVFERAANMGACRNV
jgi:hypothetical protein